MSEDNKITINRDYQALPDAVVEEIKRAFRLNPRIEDLAEYAQSIGTKMIEHSNHCEPYAREQWQRQAMEWLQLANQVNTATVSLSTLMISHGVMIEGFQSTHVRSKEQNNGT